MTDPAAGVGLLAAAAAGAVSFLSPCVLPLVPGYPSAVTGVSPDHLDEAPLHRVLLPSLAFVATSSAIFVLLGLSATPASDPACASTAERWRRSPARSSWRSACSSSPLCSSRLNREWHVSALMRRAGREGPFVAGGAFAIAWTALCRPDAWRDPLRRLAL